MDPIQHIDSIRYKEDFHSILMDANALKKVINRLYPEVVNCGVSMLDHIKSLESILSHLTDLLVRMHDEDQHHQRQLRPVPQRTRTTQQKKDIKTNENNQD